jgi:hypothetical protein
MIEFADVPASSPDFAVLLDRTLGEMSERDRAHLPGAPRRAGALRADK